MKKRKKLVLLDAHAIIHRAYHGMPDFTTRAGVPTGAIYGFITMILRMIDDFKPDYIVACYDLPKPTFRHEAFAEYKGTRSKTDEALKMQFPVTREVCDIFSIPIYDAEGFEADDILGTIAKQVDGQEVDVIIASGDMDTLQLADNDRVKIFTLKRGMSDTVVYNEEAVRERFGFAPLSIIDYKALRGDASDNIPGIRGIGDKAATLAITKFGTIEKMYEALEDSEENLLETGLTKRMVKLISEGREDAEFSKVLATIRTDAPIEFSFPENDWRTDIDVEAAIEVFQKYELRSLPNRLFQTLNIDISTQEKEEEIIEEIPESDIHETAVALCVLDSDETDADEAKIKDYSGERAFEKAKEKILSDLEKQEKNYKVFSEIEKPLIPVVNKMQENGILIDKKFFENLSAEYHAELEIFEKKIFELAGTEFNIRSPKQLSGILFVNLELPTKGVKKSKTGSYSTNADVLEKLHDEHEIIPLVLEYRELHKLLSTYIDVIPTLVSEDGRLRAEFLQNGTATGRFSSRNPNLQNIPTRTEQGRKIREGFVAPAGRTLVSFDYSQVELRILAILSRDENLIEIFKEGRDIHTAVAAKIGGVDEKDVDREMRRKAKIVNFGILYGMGVRSVHREMGGEKKEAQKFYNGFFEQFPRAAAFLEKTKDFAHAHGYTETLFGRRRQFRKINAKLPFIRAMAERMATNAPIQGSAADIIKLAMVESAKILSEFDDAKIILQIHDEIVFEINEKDEKEFSEKIISIMKNILSDSYLKYKTEVPLLIHSSAGKHWGELK